MPNYWILKTEPSTYSYDDLARAKRTVWDGVKNPVALHHLGQMRPGDEVLIYHTGTEKAAVGRASVVSEPYVDPKKNDPKLLVIEIKAGPPLRQRITLAQIKADAVFKDSALVRIARLSVVPATAAHWDRLTELSRGDGRSAR